MHHNFTKIFVSFAMIVASFNSCLDPYTPTATTNDVRQLVVNAFLNATDNSCIVNLSRTIPINSTQAVPDELNAAITLEEMGGVKFLLNEVGAGKYEINNLPLNFSSKYRIKIVTADDVEYISDFVNVKQTPVIDSISWSPERNGIQIQVSTHNDEGNTRYYQWRYRETWEYTSAFFSGFKEQGNQVVNRPFDEEFFYCYKSQNFTNILIGSSAKLQTDIISNFGLILIPWTSSKISRKYSIYVEQFTLSKEAYEYWEQLKKNTENLGTLFDPQPSRIVGNILCVTNPSEVALGFFSASSVQKTRKFITASNLRKDFPSGVRTISGYESCVPDSVITSMGEPFNGKIPLQAIYDGPSVIGYMAGDLSCADCRFAGGVTTKPDFWD